MIVLKPAIRTVPSAKVSGTVEFECRGIVVFANLHRVRTAREVRAAFRWIEHVRGSAFDGFQSISSFGIVGGHGRSQSHGVGMSRAVEDIVGRSVLHNSAR